MCTSEHVRGARKDATRNGCWHPTPPFWKHTTTCLQFCAGWRQSEYNASEQRPSAGSCLKFPVGLRDKCHINVLTPGAQPMIKFCIFAISHAPTVPAEQPEATSGRRHSKTLAGVRTMRSSSGPEATRGRGPSSSRQISVRDTFTPVQSVCLGRCLPDGSAVRSFVMHLRGEGCSRTRRSRIHTRHRHKKKKAQAQHQPKTPTSPLSSGIGDTPALSHRAPPEDQEESKAETQSQGEASWTLQKPGMLPHIGCTEKSSSPLSPMQHTG